MKVEEARAKGVEDSTADKRAAESKGGNKGGKSKTPRRRKGRKSSSEEEEEEEEEEVERPKRKGAGKTPVRRSKKIESSDEEEEEEDVEEQQSGKKNGGMRRKEEVQVNFQSLNWIQCVEVSGEVEENSNPTCRFLMIMLLCCVSVFDSLQVDFVSLYVDSLS